MLPLSQIEYPLSSPHIANSVVLISKRNLHNDEDEFLNNFKTKQS